MGSIAEPPHSPVNIAPTSEGLVMPTLAAKAIRDAPQLTEEMTRADLVEVLEHLPWQGDCSLVCVDRGVVTYLTRLLRENGTRRY
jgi:hypothetical protein